MIEQPSNLLLKNRDTYIYIDVSNIRSACLRTLGFMIDFARLLDYFKQKYPNLKEVRYYNNLRENIKSERGQLPTRKAS